MRKLLIAIISVVAIGFGAYYYYFLKGSETTPVWKSVPEKSVAVMQLSKVMDWWYDHEDVPSVNRLFNADFMKDISYLIQESDTLLKKKGYSIFDLSGDKDVLVIFTKTTKGISPALVFSEADGDDAYLKALYDGFAGKSGKEEIQEANHEGIGYTVLKDIEQKMNIYFARYKGVVCVSYAQESFLEILSTLKSDKSNKGLLAKKQIHESTEVTTESVSIYVNPVMLFKAIKPFLKNEDINFINALEHFADNAFLDIKIDDEAFYLNGFTHDSDTAFTFANCLKSQVSIPFNITDVLPNRTLSFAYLGVSDGASFKKSLEEYDYSSSKYLEKGWNELRKNYQINANDVYGQLNGEVVLLEVMNRLKEIDQLVYMKPQRLDSCLNYLNKSARIILDQTSELQTEMYNDVEITYLGELDFPGLVFGEYFAGFQGTYFAPVGNYIVMSESAQAIKGLVNDMESDEVWSRELDKNYLVERYFSDANFGYYVDIQQSLNWLESNLSKRGKKSFDQYQGLLSQMEMFSIQISNENEKLFTNVTTVLGGAISQSNDSGADEIIVQKDEKIIHETYLEFPIISKPFVVQNHVDRSREVLVQDSSFQLHLLSTKGEELWTYDLDGPITTSVYQVDVYKNQKLQYLFATPKSVYCLDRKGGDVDNYPFQLSYGDGAYNHLSVIDYDGNKNYRLAVTTTDGYIVLYDIEGNPLEGWDPKRVDGILTQSPKHMRVRGKDFLLFANKDKLHVFNRRGEYYDGFPAAVGGEINSKWYLNSGPSFRKSLISTVVDQQRVVQINLNGKETKTIDFSYLGEQPSLQLVASPGSEQSVYLARSGDEWKVFNNEKKELLSVELPYDDVQLQYYPIRNKEVFVLISPSAGKILLYNKKGKLLNGEALNGSHQIALLYKSARDVYQVYVVNRKSYRLMEIAVE